MYSLIVTAKMNDIDPQAWLADVVVGITEHTVQKLDELLPWNRRHLTSESVRRPDKLNPASDSRRGPHRMATSSGKRVSAVQRLSM